MKLSVLYELKAEPTSSLQAFTEASPGPWLHAVDILGRQTAVSGRHMVHGVGRGGGVGVQKDSVGSVDAFI